jgi:hypothetical protein
MSTLSGNGVTMRPAASAILTIDSEDRFLNYDARRLVINKNNSFTQNTPSNFQIAGERSLLTGFMTRIGVTEINYAWGIPNINKKTNQIQFDVKDPTGTITTYIITLGNPPLFNPVFLKPSEIAASIQTKIIAAVPALAAFTFTYGFNNEPIFFATSNTPGYTFAFFPMSNNTVAYPFPNNTRQLFDLLGFDSVASDLTASLTQYGGGYSFGQATRYVDIVCSQLTGRQGLGDGTSQQLGRDSICRVYVGASTNNTVTPSDPNFAPPGTLPTIIHRLYPAPKMMNWDTRTNIGSSLAFQVYDDEGTLVDVSAGYRVQCMDWSMTLLATEN